MIKLEVHIKTDIAGTQYDEADPGLDGITFVKDTFANNFNKVDPSPLTRYTHDNIRLSPLEAMTWNPNYSVEYIYIFLRRICKITIGQIQNAVPVEVDIETKLLELQGTFTSIKITSLETENITEGMLILLGKVAV